MHTCFDPMHDLKNMQFFDVCKIKKIKHINFETLNPNTFFGTNKTIFIYCDILLWLVLYDQFVDLNRARRYGSCF